ncbi:hypothetical protein [Marimonas arenosa]|uniref:Uncharacterized protein n=1 Tax=Marimonas arenosa TaxID=1795305 RepID=A0AAE3WGI2_9RHOB|nr:hypothetical protein [Marimonas arenosa]MDQ2092204.1 hypothetical protein [Marimonas arenosa]
MKHACLVALLTAIAPPIAAEQVFSENIIVSGVLCAGGDCAAGESFGDEELKLKENFTDLLFEDTSTSVGFPTTDWMLTANDAGYLGESHFSVKDMDTGWTPFRVEGGARSNALVVDNLGYVGVGTQMPFKHLHIVDGYRPTIRFEQDGSLGETPATWDILTYENAFIVKDATNAKNPFVIESNAPEYSLYVHRDRKIGFGTGSPEASLHIHGYLGKAQVLVHEVSSTTAPRPLLSLQNNGRPEILLGNTDTNGEWSFGAGTNFILKQGPVGTPGSAKTRLFMIDPAGNATLSGTLTTGGSTCGGGCDAVFSDNYDLPSITDHAEQMFALGHLPNVGPTPEGAPVDVTDKLGRVLNELEHAHIYIAQQEDRIATLAAQLAALRAEQKAEIAALAARLTEIDSD